MRTNEHGLIKGLCLLKEGASWKLYHKEHPYTGRQHKRAISSDSETAIQLAKVYQAWLESGKDPLAIASWAPALQEWFRVDGNTTVKTPLVLLPRGIPGEICITKILQENVDLKKDVIRLTQRLEDAEARMTAMGLAVGCSKQAVQGAVDDFLGTDLAKSGTGTKKRSRKQQRSWLNRFALKVPKPLNEITTEDVIQHLANCEKGEYTDGEKMDHETVRRIGQLLNAFLSHKADTWKREKIKVWMKTHLETRDAARARKGPPLWLDLAQVEALIAKMPQYWADVATIQFAGAYRPEELPTLQNSKVTEDDNGDIRIEVTDFNGWTPKALSHGKVHCHSLNGLTEKALERLKQNGQMLFPRDGKPWNQELFCLHYIEELRKAAKGLISDHDINRNCGLDSRCLRRSCGKRVLIDSDFNIGLCAGQLRDTEATVRKHYAWIIPSDVRQPALKPKLKIMPKTKAS